MAPARKMLDAGARLAIGSDFNPGSCHWGNLLQMAKMSAPTLKLNIAELICSITYNAALALKLEGAHGIIPGAKPRFYINPEHQSLSELIYSW
jgi:imidazolonepropionase